MHMNIFHIYIIWDFLELDIFQIGFVEELTVGDISMLNWLASRELPNPAVQGVALHFQPNTTTTPPITSPPP